MNRRQGFTARISLCTTLQGDSILAPAPAAEFQPRIIQPPLPVRTCH